MKTHDAVIAEVMSELAEDFFPGAAVFAVIDETDFEEEILELTEVV